MKRFITLLLLALAAFARAEPVVEKFSANHCVCCHDDKTAASHSG
jgi:hypothetical protein